MGKKVAMNGHEIGPDTVYQATYSGIPVYEFYVGREIVMRRRADDWLNATHFLKVAGLDKPQRTRILEREIQKGVHEKVQGGYGKSQGTYIPFESGVELAKRYEIEHLLRPLLELDASKGTPPPAPKHITAPPTKRIKKDANVINELPPARGGAQMGLAAPPPLPAGPVVPPISGRGRGGSRSNAASARGQASRSLMQAANGMPYGMAPAPVGAVQMHQQMGLLPGSHVYGTASGLAPAADINHQYSMAAMANHHALDGGVSLTADDSFDQDEESSPLPSQSSSASRTPSPITQQHSTPVSQQPQFAANDGSMRTLYPGVDGDSSMDSIAYGNPLKRKLEPLDGSDEAGPSTSSALNGFGISPETYGNIILDYFITEKARIPDFLVDPPSDFDPNVVIDDDGHTALHWACAMGRIRVVKLLLSAGADIFKVNHAEQTALMRSVMFSNNYDVRKFPELYQLLHRSTLNIDRNNRTVFHHIADVALSKGKTHAARYYMETILHHLEDFPQELQDVINFQDEEGETALTLAARARSKRLVRALLDHGADPRIANRDGKTAEDYILEDERFRSSPSLSAKLVDGGVLISQKYAPQLYHSQAAQSAAGQATNDLTTMLEDLAQSFDAELQQKEKDVIQAEGLLASLKAEIEEAQRTLASLASQTKPDTEALERELEETMKRRYRASWDAWLAAEKQREEAWIAAGKPDTPEYADLKARYEDQDVGRLRSEIEASEREKVESFKKIVSLKGMVGTGEHMAQYRKIISAAINAMKSDEVDEFLAGILEVGGTKPQHSPKNGSANLQEQSLMPHPIQTLEPHSSTQPNGIYPDGAQPTEVST